MLLLERTEKVICTIDNDARPIRHDYYDEFLNGEFTLEFTIPADVEYTDQIKEGHYVAFKDIDGKFQMFEIMEVVDRKDGSFEKEVFCENVIIELNDEPIKDIRPTNTTAEFALGQVLTGTRWQVGTVASLGNKSTNFYDTDVISALSRILAVWGGEYRTRIEIAGKQVTGRFIDIFHQRGNNTGKRITNNKDIITLERTVDTTRLKTALIGRGKGEELESGGFGRRITFADINDGLDYVEDTTATNLWGRINPDNSKRPLFGYFEDRQEEDPAMLLEKTLEALERVKTPLVSYKINFFDFESFGLNHEKVRLGDTVVVIDDDFTPSLELTARVIRIKRSLTDPAKGMMVLGNFLPALEDDDRISEVVRDLNQKSGIWDQSTDTTFEGPVPTSWLDGQIDTLQNRLVASGEFQQSEPIENVGLLFENNDVMSVSHGAIYIGPNTLAIASERDPVSNDWNWRSWGSGQGFTADVLTAGTLKGGKVNFNLEEGTLLIGDSALDYDLYFDGTNLNIDLSNEGSQITTIVRGSEEYSQDLSQIDDSAREYAEQEAIKQARQILGVTNHELAVQAESPDYQYVGTDAFRGLEFEITNDIHIGQVNVPALSVGEYIVELRDGDNTVHKTKTFLLSSGDNLLFLDFLLVHSVSKTWRLVGKSLWVDGVRASIFSIWQDNHSGFPYSSGSVIITTGLNETTPHDHWSSFRDIEIAGRGVTGQRDESITRISSEVTQTANSFNIQFTEQANKIDEINDYIEGTEGEEGLKTYFNFSPEGLIIGNTRASDPFIMRITNNELSFEDAGNKVAWINTSQLYITDAKIVKSIHLGAHLIESRGTGSNQMTAIKWIGGVAG